jgi:fructose-1,6-bisphosphatase I/sedoheptulose-1,7-bisphosphatase
MAMSRMPAFSRKTLAQFLIEERRKHPAATGELNALILDIALACKAISRAVAHGALAGVLGEAASINAQGEAQKKLDLIANEVFLRSVEWGGHLCGVLSEELDHPAAIPERHCRGKYLLAFDPLDGSSNVDVNVSVGSIFSILHAVRPGEAPRQEDFLQPGARQVCAGYVIYGPATMIVLTVGTGAHGFTLDPQLQEFMLTHPNLGVPEHTGEFAINASNARHWEPAVRRYVDECLAGRTGPRGRDFNMRWIASLVAEAHRILMRGGIFLYPRDSRPSGKAGRLRLLYEANPIAYVIEQAGGAATTGYERVLDVAPAAPHQRVGLMFGARAEIERLCDYHRRYNEGAYDAPLFGERGLFRAAAEA